MFIASQQFFFSKTLGESARDSLIRCFFYDFLTNLPYYAKKRTPFRQR